MKKAEEWCKHFLQTDDATVGQIKSVKQIQLDAWKQGMEDAANIANSAKVREDAHNTNASIQVSIMGKILAARDNKTSL